MIIIGLCGFIGSGKDTFADYLVKEHGFLKLSFGSAVKDVISAVFGWRRDLLEGDTEELRNFRNTIDKFWSKELDIPEFTPRIAMQKIGTELFRKNFNDEIWIKIVKRQIMENKHRNIVISDCRFPNELGLINRCDGIVIHVKRNLPSWFQHYRNLIDVEEVLKLHPSETSWIRWNFNYEVENYKSITDYYNNIRCLVVEIRESSIIDPFTSDFTHGF